MLLYRSIVLKNQYFWSSCNWLMLFINKCCWNFKCRYLPKICYAVPIINKIRNLTELFPLVYQVNSFINSKHFKQKSYCHTHGCVKSYSILSLLLPIPLSDIYIYIFVSTAYPIIMHIACITKSVWNHKSPIL